MQLCSRWLKSPRQILKGRKEYLSSPSFLSLWKPDYVTRSKSDGPHKKRVAIIGAGPCGLVAFILLNKFGVSTLPVETWWRNLCVLNILKSKSHRYNIDPAAHKKNMCTRSCSCDRPSSNAWVSKALELYPRVPISSTIGQWRFKSIQFQHFFV